MIRGHFGRLVCGFVTLWIAAGSVAAQGNQPFYQVSGASPDAKMGVSVARVPDIDGDGNDEFVAGSHRFDGPTGADVGRVSVYSGKTGRVLWHYQGGQAGGLLGHNVWGIASTATTTGTGWIVAGAYRYSSLMTGPGRNGRVEVLDHNGNFVWGRNGTNPSDELSYSLGSLDLNGDGNDDVIAGAWNSSSGTFLGGEVFIFDGTNGSTLRAHLPANARERLGSGLAGVGNIDGDTVPDYVIGALDAPGGTTAGPGAVYVMAGASGATLATLVGMPGSVDFGHHVTGLDDLNNDGFNEFLVGDPTHNNGPNVAAGMVYVYSGQAPYPILTTIPGPLAGVRFGRFAARVPDTNGDTVDEFAVGAPLYSGLNQNLGAVFLYDGATQTLIRRYDGPSANSQFGFAVCGLNDVNDDNRGDLAVGAFQYQLQNVPGPFTFSRGRTQVFVEETLTASASTLSVSNPQPINFAIDAGTRHAGRTYQLLFTANGFLPGFQIPAINMHLPLNPGQIFILSFNISNSPVFQNAFAVTNAQGKGQATLNVPPGLLAGQGNSGINFRFAYYMVVRQDHSSNMWRVGLVP